MNRNLIFYILTVVIFGSLVWFVLGQGTKLEFEQITPSLAGESREVVRVVDHPVDAVAQDGATGIFLTNLSQKIVHPLSRLLLQIAVIVVFSRALANLVARVSQPLVMGEIIAGILLSPSVLGLFWPGISNFLFHSESLPNLQFP